MRLTDIFVLNELRIDNDKGWGAVPYNSNVDYMGLRVQVKPSVFLTLAHKLDDARSSGDIENHLKSGGSVASPFFTIKVPDEWLSGNFSKLAKIRGHEGRNRMTAILRAEGDIPVETHLFFNEPIRNRHLTPDIIEALNKGIIAQDDEIVQGPWFVPQA